MKQALRPPPIAASQHKWPKRQGLAPLVMRRTAEHAVLLPTLLAGLGCSAPDVGPYNCDTPCKTTEDCSGDMMCREGFCVRPGMQGSCSAASSAAGSSAVGGWSYLGGTTGTGGPAVGTSGTTYVGGTGAAPASGSTAPHGGEPPASQGGTTGSTTTGGTASHGGDSPKPQGGITGSTTTGGTTPQGEMGGSGGIAGTAGVAGVPPRICTPEEIPIIVTPAALPAGCSTQLYGVDLEASGGKPSDLEWTMVEPLPPELGVTLTGNRLGGVLGKASASGYSMTIAVRNKVTDCVSVPRTFQLLVQSDVLTNSGCPAIRVAGKGWSDTPVPPFCKGWPYTVEFDVSNPNSESAYTWSGSSMLPGLQFDSVTKTLSGTPTAKGTITLQITEKTGTAERVFRKSYDVPIRDKCWLAYLDGKAGEERIHLRDPYLTDLYTTDPYRRPRIKDPPDSSKVTGISMTDFQFSPNGRFLAYRVKAASNIQTLWIWQGPLWDHEQALVFDPNSSVSYYAWSGNSNVLAVAYTTSDGSTKLGGIDVSLVEDEQTAPGIQKIRKLDAIAAPVNSELTWSKADAQVAFVSPTDASQPQGAQTVNYAELGLTGFSTPVSPGIAPYDTSVVLFPGTSGFFATNTVNPVLYFYAPQQFPHNNEAIAPNGNYTASAANNALNVFPANASTTASNGVPFASAGGCTQLLAWGWQQERLACVNETDTSIHAYSFDATKAELSDAKVTGSDGLFAQSWKEHSRLVSAKSGLLGVALDNYLYIVSLSQVPPAVVRSNRSKNSTKSTGLSFSPDETALVFQRDQSLILYDSISKDIDYIELGNAAEAPQPCQEQDLSVPSWCGRNTPSARALWSSDSGLVAFRSSAGELLVQDVRTRSNQYLESSTVIVNACEGGCVDGFEFQP